MFLPLGTVLHSHSSAHNTTAFVKQRATILTFAVKQESGACCSTHRLCSPCSWRSCSELRAKHCLPCPSPDPSTPLPAILSLPRKAGVTTPCRHCVTQCPKHVPSLQLLLLLRKIANRHCLYQRVDVWWYISETVPLLCWLWGRSTARGRPCFWQLVRNSRSFLWNGCRLHRSEADEHSAPAKEETWNGC